MTNGQKRADKIIEREMLRLGTILSKTRNRDYPQWEQAMYELQELGLVGKQIHGQAAPTMAKTPNLEFSKEVKRQHDGARLDRGLFDGN